MRNNNYEPIVILALNKDTISDDYIEIAEVLDLYKIKRLKGKYTHDDGTGIIENSYIIPLLHVTVSDCIRLARDNKQESILYIDNQREAWLYYCNDGIWSHLGSFTRVSKDYALKQDNYTLDNSSNNYYCCI